MVDRRLRLVLNAVLAAVMVEDALLFLMAWFWPGLWFQVFHHSVPGTLEIAFLRRSAGQWLAFALGQALTLTLWRKAPVWLVMAAGLRVSDLFTDVSYVISAPHLTTTGYLCLLPPPVLNAVFIALLLRGYKRATASGAASV